MQWLLAGATLLLGIVWRDCVLVAGSALLAVQVFYDGMDQAAPWSAWRAAVRCSLGGVAIIGLGMAVALFVAGKLAGWWLADADHADAAIAAARVAASALGGLQTAHRLDLRRMALGLLALVCAVGALAASHRGVPYAACAFAGMVALLLMGIGWHLAHNVAAQLGAADRRH
jgi:hypothetical protein